MSNIYVQLGVYSVFVFEQTDTRQMLEYFDRGRIEAAVEFCKKRGVENPEVRDCPHNWR